MSKDMIESLSITLLNRINGPLHKKTMSTQTRWALLLSSTTGSPAFLCRWRCWLCFLFGGGGGGNERLEGGKEEPGRQTKRVYWLVLSSSVDCDKFNCGNPLKADASPHQPPPPIISPSLPLSFTVLSAADLWGQLSYVCSMLIDVWGCIFVLHAQAAETVIHNCFECRF